MIHHDIFLANSGLDLFLPNIFFRMIEPKIIDSEGNEITHSNNSNNSNNPDDPSDPNNPANKKNLGYHQNLLN